MLEQAAQADAADDERFGDARGDELPPELAGTSRKVGSGRRGGRGDAGNDGRLAAGPAAERVAPAAASRRATHDEIARRVERLIAKLGAR